jgi:hypothetical protein
MKKVVAILFSSIVQGQDVEGTYTVVQETVTVSGYTCGEPDQALVWRPVIAAAEKYPLVSYAHGMS